MASNFKSFAERYEASSQSETGSETESEGLKRRAENEPASRGSLKRRGTSYGSRPGSSNIRTRPVGAGKQGSTGEPVLLSANYFRLTKKPEFEMCQYRVDFSPDIEQISTRQAILRVKKDFFGGYMFDGTSMFLTKRFPDDFVEFQGKTRDGSEVTVTVKFVSTINMSGDMAIKILNLIMRKSMGGLNLQLVQRNFFDAAAKIDIPQYKLQLWPGYITSIRQHETDVLLCSEISHKVMRMETVRDLMRKLLSASTQDYKTVIAKEVIGMVVLTEYNNKTYRVDDIDWKSNPKSTFETKNGPVSYLDYYKKQYNKTIQDENQPLLVSKPKAKDLRGGQASLICLVPELCRPTGLTDEMRSNFHLMKDLATHTRLRPKSRFDKLMNFNRRLQQSKESSQILSDWNMGLDRALVEFPGRLLPQEVMKFGGNRDVKNSVKADWTQSLRTNEMFSVCELTRWGIMYPIKFEAAVDNFLKLLKTSCDDMKYPIKPPKKIQVYDDRTDSYIRSLSELLNNDPKLVMCVVPDKRVDRYSAIKKLCCIDRAVPTQVIVAKTIMPKPGGGFGNLPSIAMKVAIQMNCKLGGAPWMIGMPLRGLMTLGFDVCHDTRDKRRSFGALIATMDLKQKIAFYSTVFAHTNGEELCNQLTLGVMNALRSYHEEHNELPSRILFYRDGVGEGQVEYIQSQEVMQIKGKISEIYKKMGKSEPSFCFILVNKRLNTRIFHKGDNPAPGCVVDDVITLPERYDFFLVSQTVREGTVSPTSYNIIHDTTGLSADKIQILTYKMCHLYYNWSGTTRVPAVCQYAHKLAFLVGQYLHQAPSSSWNKQLYFL